MNEEEEATAACLEFLGFDVPSCVQAVRAAGGKYDLALKILNGRDYSSTPIATASSASSSTDVQANYGAGGQHLALCNSVQREDLGLNEEGHPDDLQFNWSSSGSSSSSTLGSRLASVGTGSSNLSLEDLRSAAFRNCKMERLQSMGFNQSQCKRALDATKCDFERAIEFLLNANED